MASLMLLSFLTPETHPCPHYCADNHPRSLPLSLTACPYFWSFVINWSPCFTTSAYCLFLSSGRFVSMMPLTRSIVQGIRFAAMNLAKSLSLIRQCSNKPSQEQLTCRGNQQRHQSHWPCFADQPPCNSGAVAGRLSAASRGHTSPCARAGTCPG